MSLVIAANFAFEKLRPKTKDNIYGEKVVIKEEENDDEDTPEPPLPPPPPTPTPPLVDTPYNKPAFPI